MPVGMRKVCRPEQHVPEREYRSVIVAAASCGSDAVMRTVEAGRDEQPVANPTEADPGICVADALKQAEK